jgi:UDP-N-acetylglucosamine:LPS N-acetylglucosamine transferase
MSMTASASAAPRDVAAARRPRVLLVSSGGGHWVQLLRLRPAFEGCDTTFVCVRPEYRVDVPGCRFFAVNDATRWNKFGLLLLALRVLVAELRVRPDVVVSTGAAPGYFALRFAKLLGARTVWIDSIANVERLSMTGALVRRYADRWLTQWPQLARPEGPQFAGAVL